MTLISSELQNNYRQLEIVHSKQREVYSLYLLFAFPPQNESEFEIQFFNKILLSDYSIRFFKVQLAHRSVEGVIDITKTINRYLTSGGRTLYESNEAQLGIKYEDVAYKYNPRTPSFTYLERWHRVWLDLQQVFDARILEFDQVEDKYENDIKGIQALHKSRIEEISSFQKYSKKEVNTVDSRYDLPNIISPADKRNTNVLDNSNDYDLLVKYLIDIASQFIEPQSRENFKEFIGGNNVRNQIHVKRENFVNFLWMISILRDPLNYLGNTKPEIARALWFTFDFDGRCRGVQHLEDRIRPPQYGNLDSNYNIGEELNGLLKKELPEEFYSKIIKP